MVIFITASLSSKINNLALPGWGKVGGAKSINSDRLPLFGLAGTNKQTNRQTDKQTNREMRNLRPPLTQRAQEQNTQLGSPRSDN